MEACTKKYFDLSWAFLKSYIGLPYADLIERYTEYPEDCVLEEIDGYCFLAFTYGLVPGLERCIVLVYEQEQIIADCSYMVATMDDVMKKRAIYDAITLDSDWSNLEHFTLCNYMFDLPYPYYLCESSQSFDGLALFFTNAYVTKAYRRQGLFFQMLDCCKEMALRYQTGDTLLYSIFSLDPDIPCYGPDTKVEPYYYSMKDEPTRLLNASILAKRGYESVRLEDEEENDGSKLWYALLKEKEHIVEIDTI